MIDEEYDPKHDYVVSYHPSDYAKFIAGLLFAGAVAFQAANVAPHTLGNVLQAVVIGIAAVAIVPASPGQAWWNSGKLYVSLAGTVLSALIPLLVSTFDNGGIHNLTGYQWMIVVLSALKTAAVVIIPNTKTAKIPSGWAPSDEPVPPKV